MKPRKRSDCEGKELPCPFISCRHHMIWGMAYLEENGDIRTYRNKLIDDDKIVEMIANMKCSCVLDAIDSADHNVNNIYLIPLEEIGEMLGVTRQRIEQISGNKATRLGLNKLRSRKNSLGLAEYHKGC